MSRYTHSHRSNLRKAGFARREDAQVLFEGGRYGGAVYLAGYRIECALKVALMEVANVEFLRDLEAWLLRRGVHRPDRVLHNLEVLSAFHPGVERLRLNPAGRAELVRDRIVCHTWSPELRYGQSPVTQEQAQRFLDSVDRYSSFIQNSL